MLGRQKRDTRKQGGGPEWGGEDTGDGKNILSSLAG
jgi:hypothetical protein